MSEPTHVGCYVSSVAATVDGRSMLFGVLALNSPPRFPRYNGGMGKCIRDFKSTLAQRTRQTSNVPADFALAATPISQ